jgi:RND superfamily putative drug exporter
VAARLPILLLTMMGLLVAAGSLVFTTHVAPVSIWALNFAPIFALALGIHSALLLVVAMGYTLSMLSAAMERYETHAGPEQAEGGLLTLKLVEHLGV